MEGSQKSMKNITEISPVEFRKMLGTLVHEEIFKSRERLTALLAKDSSRKELDAEFMEFHGDYEDLGFWFETYTEDPLKGLDPHASLTKKLKRQRNHILANRKTTLEERIYRRMGIIWKAIQNQRRRLLNFHWINTANSCAIL